MAQILYRGAQTHGVTVGPQGEETYVPHGEPVEVDDELADALLAEYPEDFTLVTGAVQGRLPLTKADEADDTDEES
jgi:hypothetical protein